MEFFNWLTMAQLESSSDQPLHMSTLAFTLRHHQVLKSFRPGTFHPWTQNSQSPIDLQSKSAHPIFSRNHCITDSILLSRKRNTFWTFDLVIKFVFAEYELSIEIDTATEIVEFYGWNWYWNQNWGIQLEVLILELKSRDSIQWYWYWNRDHGMQMVILIL